MRSSRSDLEPSYRFSRLETSFFVFFGFQLTSDYFFRTNGKVFPKFVQGCSKMSTKRSNICRFPRSWTFNFRFVLHIMFILTSW